MHELQKHTELPSITEKGNRLHGLKESWGFTKNRLKETLGKLLSDLLSMRIELEKKGKKTGKYGNLGILAVNHEKGLSQVTTLRGRERG